MKEGSSRTAPLKPTPPPRPETFPPSSDARSVFQPLVESLKARTKLPIRVPDRLPEMGQSGRPVHAEIEDADESSYQITIGLVPDCGGANACRIATLSAERLSEETSALGEGTKVELPAGRTAYYEENECGASCPDNTITWDQDGVRYKVGIKAGRLEQLLKLAGSVASSQPR